MLVENRPSDSSLELMHFLMQQKEISVFVKDEQRKYIESNLNFLQQSGLSSLTSLSGKTDYDLIWTKEEAGDYRLGDKEVIDTGKAKIGYMEHQTDANGNVHWIETSKFPLWDIHNQIIGVIGYYHSKNELYEKVAKRCCQILSGRP